jgi:preprotein translocase subunit SecY
MLGLHIPLPGIDHRALERLMSAPGQGALQFLDLFSGGALRRFSIFALGITPYIDASILMQLLSGILPALEQLAKEGESGRKKITQYTRSLTAVFAVGQGMGLLALLSYWHILQAAWWTSLQILVTLCAGTALVVWLGEQITERGIGQGMSLLVFGSIMASMPGQVSRLIQGFSFERGAMIGPFELLRLVLLFLATTVAVVYVTQATRRIPVQHARRPVGTQGYPGGSSFLPVKLNSAGVMPILFALALLNIPATIAGAFQGGPYARYAEGVIRLCSPGASVVASLIYAGLILLFTYLYGAIQVKIPEWAENLSKSGSFIPGIRPGRATQEYLDRVVSRITFAGAVFLAALGLAQCSTHAITGVSPNQFSLIQGTSLLIVVGVALDTMQSLDSHISMGSYRGFIRAGDSSRTVKSAAMPPAHAAAARSTSTAAADSH